MNDHPQPSALRVFVALAPPDDAKDELAQALQSAYATYPRLRWNRIEDWHITLAFLGELPATAALTLQPALAALAASHPAPHLGLRGGGHFDERLLWSGIDGDLDALHQLATDVRNAVRSCGIEFNERPLRPHLTLARSRRDDPASVPQAAAALTAFVGRPWRAERLHLVGGALAPGPGPVRYRDIEAWRLGAATGPAGP
ncbi:MULTISPECIES: RNA 2',3'-cyclic phosphodiesterase [unclassified Kitasatospora]|uniref:RNA 2',3'-cyclic phosphodiesterase n=1 Tax=unclassified Kitasatospora TaxID=2633591 RepID=UPI000710F39F|nr:MULTISPECIES: RNA 2',3'-cyclic phosphodiesterase [unclassified Kitasatospora]KQV15826.1 2'-5' RNA ligase [Kitasatospora sp. Root107]KRB65076.1 2'-5' RNA ligase [Kitasatospora sp. Root187]